MCGIFGILRLGGLSLDDRWKLRRMADAIQHRGPDGDGFHIEPDVAIGMTRLAIIDKEGGWQPIYNEDRTVALVANGEIYNFIELRHDLESRGHRFRTGSDCESIVHLYEEYGTDCVHHLRGMFAFALIDLNSRRLLLARDRMGEKPIMLAEVGDSLVFCSELAALVGSGAVPFVLNPVAVKFYYYWGYVPEPLSAVTGTRKLPAGTLLDIDLHSGRRTERTYWRLEDSPPIEGNPVARIREEIETIGRITMRSDVPVGIGLSSGIDSSAIAVMAQRHADQPVTAFSVGFEGKTWQDESGLAEEFAKHLGIDFYSVKLDVDRVVREFPHVCVRRDDPVADMAGSNIYALMRLSRDHGVRVLFSGLGGDELFWGYQWHRRATLASERKRNMLRGEVGLIDYLCLQAPPISITGLINWCISGAGLISGIQQRHRDRSSDPTRLVFWDNFREFRSAEKFSGRVFGDRLRGCQDSPASIFTGHQFWDSIRIAMTERLCSTYLRANGLNQTDRLSMACSVEARMPLVDYRLAEVVIGLRRHHDDLRLGHKAWLKEVFRENVPPFVMARKKRGFSTPWRTWTRALMAAYGSDMSRGVLVSNGILRQDAVGSLVGGFDALRRPMPFAMESLVLEQWARGMSEMAEGVRRCPDAEPELSSSRTADER
jgi:asparagine synthase (glutamine-hydrolysing)